jgi:hypothetical protein
MDRGSLNFPVFISLHLQIIMPICALLQRMVIRAVEQSFEEPNRP